MEEAKHKKDYNIYQLTLRQAAELDKSLTFKPQILPYPLPTVFIMINLISPAA